MNICMTMTTKNSPFLPKLLASTIAATLFAFSSSALAAKPVDRLQQLIDESTVTEQIRTIATIDADADNNQNDQLDTDEDVSLDDTSIEDASIEDDAQRFETATVNAKVSEEIKEQDDSDLAAGQAVASITPNSNDEDSIKSIENKDGKIYKTTNLSNYARAVNSATWSPNMRKNTAMTVKMQALLDWNHASPGPIDGGWGMNSQKALANFQTMKGLPSTGKMDSATWRALTKNIDLSQPVLVEYTLTQADLDTNFAPTPSGSEAKSKMKGLYYQDIKEMLGERFHMDVRYLEKLNKGKKYTVGETITVVNTGDPLKATINRVVANKADKTLYAYNNDKLVATYPTTVGSSSTPSPSGTFKIVNKVKMPWYRATVNKNTDNKQVFMLPPGPNNPVGVVWMGLSKPSYGIHGSPVPEGISRQASAGCVRLTNWDVLEVYANIEKGATVELK